MCVVKEVGSILKEKGLGEVKKITYTSELRKGELHIWKDFSILFPIEFTMLRHSYL